MALTPSHELSVGLPVPDFSLPDVATARAVSASDFGGARALVVIFLCRHCPYVVHVLPTLIAMAREYAGPGAAFVGISANDAANYPEDSPARLKDMVVRQDIPFPILYDETQATARAFHAACTPEFFVFDGDGRLFYHGRMDASTPGNNIPCTGDDLRAALDAVLSGSPPPATQHPSLGCNIKWK
ncbi:MAG: thioredoxin family protein [Chthoniobacterales bacterium]